MVAKKKSAKEKVAKKATAPQPGITPQSTTPPERPLARRSTDVKRLLAAAKPLLKALDRPSPAALKQAAGTIGRLVYGETPQTKLTLTDRFLFLLSLELSQRSLRGYSTLDPDLIAQIDSFVSTIEVYVNDTSQQRPLNFLMLASPGAGKSHFIKCVAARLATKSISAITFNMASMQSNDDLVPPLDAARNLKVEDRLPLLFLDEFDSAPGNFSLLLPLLWDGGLNLGQRDLRLGKVIVVMAGNDPELPDTMDHARSMRAQLPAGGGHNPKLIDLFSRINGGILRIPPFYDMANRIDRRADKVCIAITLLKQRFGQSLRVVPLALLRFIALVDFRYNVRSIAHLVDLIPYRKNAEQLTIEQLGLPLRTPSRLKQSSLAYHLLHEDQAYGAVKNWEDAARVNAQLVIESGWVEGLQDLRPHMREYFLPELLKEKGLLSTKA